MRVALVLFTRDLRVHDHPALAEAVRTAERVVPLFVFDRVILERFGVPNRAAFLLDSLRDLRDELMRRGGVLLIRRGDVVGETIRTARETGAEAIFLSEDWSTYAQSRERRLRDAGERERIEVRTFPGIAVVSPGDVAPAASDHFRVFTPYWRRWSATARRAQERAPARVSVPAGTRRGRFPALDSITPGRQAPELPRGGETEGHRLLTHWLRRDLRDYGRLHDDPAADATSRLSPYLHFGCLSPLDVLERVRTRDGGDAFVRQLAWRDFFAQLLAANPETTREDLRARGDRWRRDDESLQAWKEGRTGYPLVDAGMRQLLREGWMHNRARLVTASFLAKHLYLDWRLGAQHFFDHLVDGDVASNIGNWQWVAGTGADTRPNRMFNPERQAARYDPDGRYVRRYVPEAGSTSYPAPIVRHEHAVARFRQARAR
jgi:deoxyribodipyrimidine photo-lyase